MVNSQLKDLELDSETESESESENGSDSGSLFGRQIDDVEKKDYDVEEEVDEDEYQDDDVEEKTLHTKTESSSSTLRLEHDNHSFNDVEELDNEDKTVDNLESEFRRKISTKEKAYLYEFKAYEKPQNSSETINVIKEVLSNKENPTACPHCGNFMRAAKKKNLIYFTSYNGVDFLDKYDKVQDDFDIDFKTERNLNKIETTY
ncbi:hypothetical protein BpHYR1_021677 [Brachionus plicatilis]|uniref:Uncharacterized protein n=1 Tax=Brachionus plicatilis TaxID=10195 RepID=A0A3M7RV83_BRAPC|nr:hypothetical protein BpHYR1_021677 [Brachionus plicatilis]